MAAVPWDVQTWVEREFDGCLLGDRRSNRWLVQDAVQVARTDSGTPDQTEKWADLQAVYRMFDGDDATP